MGTISDIVLTRAVRAEVYHSSRDYAELGFRLFRLHSVGVSQGFGSWDWGYVPVEIPYEQ